VRRITLAATVVAALALPNAAAAHGLGAVKDLPVPLWLFYYGGTIVLVLSFAALGALWRKPRLEGRLDGRPLPEPLQRFLMSPGLRIAAGTVSFALFLIVLAACFLGEQDSRVNLGPTFIWVVFWLGLVPVVILLGNVWRVLSPWRAAADTAAWLTRRGGQSWEPAPYRRGSVAGRQCCFCSCSLRSSSPTTPLRIRRLLALPRSSTPSSPGLGCTPMAARRGRDVATLSASTSICSRAFRLSQFGSKRTAGQESSCARPSPD
jgi:hypothetical protein